MRRKTAGASIGAVAIAASLGLAGWFALPAGATSSAAPTIGTAIAGPGAGAATGGTASTGAAATGPAGVPATVSRVWLEHALARRQATLSRLTAVVERTPTLSTAVRRTLESQLAAEKSGIDALAAAAPHEPTTTLATMATTMVDQYRVYVVMVPKVRIVVMAGRQQRAEQRATHLETFISARIHMAEMAGRTVAQAVSANQDLVHQIARATSDTSASSSVLTVQPSGYPSDAGTIAAARADLESARSVVPAVRADLRAIRSSLQDS